MLSFLNNLFYAHVSMIEADALQKFTGSQKRGKQKISGINPFKKIDVCVMHAVMAVCFKPFGFSTGDVVQKLKKMYGMSLKPTQAAYVLRKLKAKKIVITQKGKRKYQASPDGLQIILAITTITEQQLPKVLTWSNNKDASELTLLKDKYNNTYFQLKRAIREFAEVSPIKIAA